MLIEGLVTLDAHLGVSGELIICLQNNVRSNLLVCQVTVRNDERQL